MILLMCFPFLLYCLMEGYTKSVSFAFQESPLG